MLEHVRTQNNSDGWNAKDLRPALDAEASRRKTKTAAPFRDGGSNFDLMVALGGASSNKTVLSTWEQLLEISARLAGSATPATTDAEVIAKPRMRRPGWVWRELSTLLKEHSEPVTPSVLRAELEAKLGEPVPASSVKDCLRRHAVPGAELRRYKGGKYRLKRS